MKNIFLISILSLLLNSQLINGVALKVNGIPITLFDIQMVQKEIGCSKLKAVKLLIQSTLEEYEIQRLGLKASQGDIEHSISKILSQNGIASKELLFQTLSYQGVSKKLFLDKIKKEILRSKLYQTIASSKISQPTEKELREIYRNNINKWKIAQTYDVTIYFSNNIYALKEKLNNPLLLSRSIQIQHKIFQGNKLNPNIRKILSKTVDGKFSEITPFGGGYALFFINERHGEKLLTFDEVVDEIKNEELFSQQQKVVQNYFDRIKAEALIEYIR